MPDKVRARGSGFDKKKRGDFNAKLQEAVEKRVLANFNRLSHLSMATVDVLDMRHDNKPKTAPSDEDNTAGKAYFFPELRSLIEGRLKETKVETLSNRLERELACRQQLYNELILLIFQTQCGYSSWQMLRIFSIRIFNYPRRNVSLLDVLNITFAWYIVWN